MTYLDPDRADELALMADDASTLDWNHEVVLAIVRGDDSDEARRLASAFRYRNNDHHPGSKGHFGPTLVAGEDGELLELTLEDTPAETCAVWEEVAADAKRPRVLATLHDLLFERRGCPHVGEHGRAAAEAYIAFGLEPTTTLAEVDSLRRAFELILLMKHDELLPAAVEATLTVIRKTLTDPDPKPGVTLRLLETLIDHHCDDPPVDELLTAARAAYPDVWTTENTLALQRRRTTDPDVLMALDREEVQANLDEAARTNQLSRLMHLETAARIARERGVKDLGEVATLALQNTNVADLGMQRFSTEMEIPRERTEQQVEQLMEADTWFEAAMRIVGAGPPSGDVESNLCQADDLAAEFPLSAMARPKHLGRDGLPRYEPTTDEEHAEARLTAQEVLTLTFTCNAFFAEAFDQAGIRFGVPDAAAVVDAFAGGHVDEATCAGIARVLRRYYDGDAEGAAYTAIPLIERLCRRLLLRFNEPIFRVQETNASGRYPGLGALLRLLRPYLDPSWYRYLKALFANPTGLNLRNDALHGHVEDIEAASAVAVLIALMYLAAAREGSVEGDLED